MRLRPRYSATSSIPATSAAREAAERLAAQGVRVHGRARISCGLSARSHGCAMKHTAVAHVNGVSVYCDHGCHQLRSGSREHESAVLCGRICSLDRIAPPAECVNDRGMSMLPSSPPSKRPADHDLYDRGCDLVEAAIEIRRLADDPGVQWAIPALLGCIEAAMHELGCAAVSLDESNDDEMPAGGAADRMHRGFMNLGSALSDAELASAAARGLAARWIAAVSASRAAGGVPDGRRQYIQDNADYYARQKR